jgi:peptidoglycan/xylan/chitin deacetylase (PgdA/CDA1 family)
MLLRHLRHFLSTKGPRHALERTAEVVWRFALGGRRFDRTLDLLERDLGPRGVRMTFCVTAGLIARHRPRIERLAALGHEIASHGLFHSRMDQLDYDRQLEILSESHRLLSDAGFRICGYRSPYLNSNADTVRALEESPYRWTSGDLIFWRNGFAANATVHRLDALYRIRESEERISVPEMRGGRVEIPLSAPDDEILYERYRVRDPGLMLKTWREVSDQVYRGGELHHLMFHPERYPRLREALTGLLDDLVARRPAVWMPTLNELADWWRARSAWSWRRVGSRVAVDAPAEAIMLVKVPREAADSAGRDDSTAGEAPLAESGSSELGTRNREPLVRRLLSGGAGGDPSRPDDRAFAPLSGSARGVSPRRGISGAAVGGFGECFPLSRPGRFRRGGGAGVAGRDRPESEAAVASLALAGGIPFGSGSVVGRLRHRPARFRRPNGAFLRGHGFRVLRFGFRVPRGAGIGDWGLGTGWGLVAVRRVACDNHCLPAARCPLPADIWSAAAERQGGGAPTGGRKPTGRQTSVGGAPKRSVDAALARAWQRSPNLLGIARPRNR